MARFLTPLREGVSYQAQGGKLEKSRYTLERKTLVALVILIDGNVFIQLRHTEPCAGKPCWKREPKDVTHKWGALVGNRHLLWQNLTLLCSESHSLNTNHNHS